MDNSYVWVIGHLAFLLTAVLSSPQVLCHF